ncbi:MAG TPA: monovalent cation/H+ antiporter complex subunit F [bacterium]|nr:monovalent cation/H+ antiporter complex subunit F [bacterium]
MNSTIILVFLSLIGLGFIFSTIRLMIGPTASDRAVAMDTITTTAVALLVLLGFVFKRYVYLDVSLVYSLLAFVGLVALARYMEKGI